MRMLVGRLVSPAAPKAYIVNQGISHPLDYHFKGCNRRHATWRNDIQLGNLGDMLSDHSMDGEMCTHDSRTWNAYFKQS